MAFDFKKEFKEFYQPKTKPSIITIPKMNYLAVRGTGDPNQEDNAYKESIELLYGVAYTLKMSHKTDYKIEGFFDYVVPPLEGFWWQEDREDVDYGHKEQFSFISVIRLPDFVSKDNVDWAISQARKKKKRDFSKVEFFTYDEGLCAQCMHVGPYNDEPKTVEAMHQFMEEEGYVLDITLERMHHEIYLGDVRKTAAEKLKTVLRHPIKKV
ncbi:GyrI-like domain-containing protein [Streptococcus caballi]|uniref:GyrI-like domain-containing protein n=1 Tax=Streptococcus caballi TaxID=439220 RepID=UPI000367A4DD|nr:GyrI-like domain-containing protein [Streptococcus caballi]